MTPQKKRHYSIRKLQAGAGSILIGTTLLFGLSTQLVQANVTADSTTSGSAGGTGAAPSVTASEAPATTAAGGETATTEENPKVEEPTEKEKPKESTPTTEATPKSQTEETKPKETENKEEAKKEEVEPKTGDTITEAAAKSTYISKLEELLKEVEKRPPLDEDDHFKRQANFWKEQGPTAKARLEHAKDEDDEKNIKDLLEDYVQFADIENKARHSQELYKKHNKNPEMLKLIEAAFKTDEKNNYDSMEGSVLEGYVRDTVTANYNKILELAKKLEEEKAKKEKEKEQPTPAPTPEEPKKDEQPAPEKPEDKDKSEKTPDSQPQQPEDKDKPTPEKPEKQPEDTDKPEEAPKKPEDTEKPADPKEPEVPKKDETPAPTPEPKKDTEKPAPSQPKQDDSMKKDYKLFYQTKDKTEEVDFKGTPEELKATLDKAIEKYKQDGYPYVDRFERENRILLVFNQHKSIIVLETNGDGGSRQSRPFYGTPQELEAEIKKLTESLSDTYKIEKKEGYDKLDPTVKTITLVLTKLSDTPKETPTPKKEDKPTPPKDEKQTQPEDKKPEQPKKDEKQTQPEDKKAEKPKDEKQTQPEDKKAEKPKDEKQTQPEGKKPEQPKDKKPVPAPKKAEKAMPSKARTPKKVLPNTGEAPSILAVLGSGLLGFLGMSQIKRRKK
ncbi:GAG-binding domain-containing protein [Streptococcus ruminantium]|uniref:GAG-binding domain-containing protein n=1 Tax=Streptococcus ruminantium TaxID=1917441 RepID=UPI0015AC83FF|nr:GAG-binding domain-containing protein [Streptococcus ruminantium]